MRTKFADAAQHADAFFVIRTISTPHNNFSPQHFSTPKRDGKFFRGPRNFCNSSQTNFQGPAAHATYSKTPNRNQTSKDISLRSENEFNKPNSDLCFYHARFGASARFFRRIYSLITRELLFIALFFLVAASIISVLLSESNHG